VNIAGLGVAAPDISGLTVGGAVGAIHISGVVVAPLFVWATSHELAAVTHDMKGVQIGLLNYNGSNRPGLRWLPLFNARFR